MIPYSRPKLSDLYTISQSQLLENYTLHSGTYLKRPYMAVPSPGEKSNKNDNNNNNFISKALLSYVQGALQSCKQHYW